MEGDKMDISISRDGLSKKQLLLLNSKEDRVLFGGARGGGKTHVIRIGAAEDALSHPGRKVLFYRPTIKSAKEQFPPSEMSKIIPREVTDPETGKIIPIWSFNANDAVYTFANGDDPNRPFDSGSRLVLGGIQTLQDAQESYQGIEYVSIWVDELTKTDFEATEYVIGSLRDVKYDTKFRAASNPGERAHKDVKKEYIVPYEKIKKRHPEKFDSEYTGKISWRKFVEDEKTGEKIETTYAYIPATLDDNPVEKIRKNYLRILSSLPMHLQKMYRYGSWDTYEGQYWDDIDEDKIFVNLADVSRYGIDFEWEKENMKTYLSMDWGYSDYSAIYWHLETSKGVIITYNELYVNKMKFDDIVHAVNTENERLDVKPSMIYMPWDVYVNKGISVTNANNEVVGESLIDMWNYYSPVPDAKASQNRHLGWQKMTMALKDEVKQKDSTIIPKWLILKYECPHLKSQINATQIDPRDPEDIKRGEDHSVDACRMFWVAHIINPKIIEEVNMPTEGTGAWVRYKMNERKSKKKKRQTSIYSNGW